ncbi:uncharacterized protein SPPG_05083 [Spizellomyces punctatus DAOM BR117]|uniref:J domain-containing protein n=1 Tax=Spizellomyces punctatus (strain DAOM BR117) TaxID=645134 RepID=A0A0L0HFY7_SPIPD|nr:uncharacterized protein SPPG_05083 [Spizellomyces punctatus DAOM BR117]KNC99703.1 hypothetical protein SPPG_05083 [Spizellomyces punctatus DAOM BR117]|eukprot:XP_016607743.1 hypothetical protein SPPG_05083 [Spizellomyces punctatus DAOM BR117]
MTADVMEDVVDLTSEDSEREVRAEAVKARANDFYKKAEYREAADLYTEAIDIRPTTGMYYANRAAALMMLRRYSDALKDCKRAIELDIDNVKAYLRASKCQLHLGQLEDADRMLRQVKVHIKGKSHLQDNAGAVDRDLAIVAKIGSFMAQVHKLIVSKQHKQALTQLEMAMITLDPTLRTSSSSSCTRLSGLDLDTMPMRWRLLRAECLIECRDLEGAAKVTTGVLSADPTNVEAITIRARVMYLQDTKPEAIPKLLMQALSYDPDNKRAKELLKKVRRLDGMKNEGNDAFKAGRYQEALDAYERCLEADDEQGVMKVKVLSNRAIVRSRLSQYDLAARDCTVAIELLEKLSFPGSETSGISPGDLRNSSNSALFSKLYLRRADCYMKLENYEDAVRDYTNAEQLKPTDGDIARALNTARNLLRQSKRKDYYKILGVARSASEVEVKKAYRKLALQCHPDKSAGLSDEEKAIAESRFKEIGEAYTVLSDPRKKHMFDSGMDVDGASASDGYSPFGHGGPPDMDILSQLFGGGMGGMPHGFAHGGSPFGGAQFGGSPFGMGGMPGGMGRGGGQRRSGHQQHYAYF